METMKQDLLMGMNKESIKKLLLNEINHLVDDLESDTKSMPFDRELVQYSEGKLNGVIGVYLKLFPESLPKSIWNKVLHMYDLINKKMEETK